jgi:hypothetical protein
MTWVARTPGTSSNPTGGIGLGSGAAGASNGPLGNLPGVGSVLGGQGVSGAVNGYVTFLFLIISFWFDFQLFLVNYQPPWSDFWGHWKPRSGTTW